MTNKHVGLRLGVAFAVLIAILLGIAQLGLRRMQTIDETLGDITGGQLANLQLARKALALSNDNNRIVMQIVLVENRALVKTLLATRSENTKEITTLVAESERRCESEKGKQLLAAVKRAREPYVESYLRAIHLLVDDGKHDEAEAVVVNEVLPALPGWLRRYLAPGKHSERPYRRNALLVLIRGPAISYRMLFLEPPFHTSRELAPVP